MQLKEALEAFPSLADMHPQPITWRQAMEAVCMGAIDHDEITELVSACIGTGQPREIHGGQLVVADGIVEGLFEAQQKGERVEMMLDEFWRIGEAADRVCAAKAAEAAWTVLTFGGGEHGDGGVLGSDLTLHDAEALRDDWLAKAAAKGVALPPIQITYVGDKSRFRKFGPFEPPYSGK